MPYEASCVSLDAGARLLVYSDGVFEIEKSDGSNWAFDEFVRFVVGAQGQSQCADQLLAEVRQLHGSDTLADDFSMLEVVF
jgi:sigma-B regulation protein RsbU (phosphoserine phosphatase)